MTTVAVTKPAPAAVAIADADDCIPPHPLSVSIRPILESVAGVLTGDEIDQWFVGLDRANEGRGFYLELTGDGELVIIPMVNRKGSYAEVELITDVRLWNRQHDGEVHGANANLRLPDGSRLRPDAWWLSPEQVAALPPIAADDGAITVCPVFVAEIMSGTDRLPPLQRKMERYIANGAQLGWLIAPYHRQVQIYRPGAPVEVLDNPETISGESVLPGFVFQVRRRIFALHD